MAAAFRPKKLDIMGNLSALMVRDNTKRQVVAKHEPERYARHYLPFTL